MTISIFNPKNNSGMELSKWQKYNQENLNDQ